jgi:peroxiredoxin Q/BCP
MKSIIIFKRAVQTLLIFSLSFAAWTVHAEPPKVGERAPDFTLNGLDESSAQLSALAAKDRVVLVVLRGWPGYQCPLCTQQVHDLVTGASDLRKRHVKMVFVYPGPADALKVHASEFLKNKDWPKDWMFLVDPDYTMVNSYGLRWDAKSETAYPSTFIIERGGKVQFAKISKEHGGRVTRADLLRTLDASM